VNAWAFPAWKAPAGSRLKTPTYVNWHFKGLALPERRTHQQEEGVMGTENFLFRDLILSPVLSATALGDLPY
jgi:hypothetical protein